MKNMNRKLSSSVEIHATEPLPIRTTNSIETANVIIGACLDAKGREVSLLDVHDVFDIADYFIIVSGRSDRQTQGLAKRILEALSGKGIKPEFVEGYDEGHWIIIDCIDVVVHIFYEPTRDQYDLEGLWVKAKKLPIHPNATPNMQHRTATAL
ncbi:ribosome silencing factor [bacterium]|nr:ribosome silencing factor [bacterium]